MQGDARRYQLSIEKDPETRSRLQAEALAAYQAATEGVEAAGLAPTNPVRLNLALNMAVFHHSALGKPEEAVRIAQTARDAAVDALDAMDEVRPARSPTSFLDHVSRCVLDRPISRRRPARSPRSSKHSAHGTPLQRSRRCGRHR